MGIIKIYHDKKWTLQFLDVLYNSIDFIHIFLDFILKQGQKREKGCTETVSQFQIRT
jgi:hypothetical protein